MNSQELVDYLNQVSEENPLVEQTDLAELHRAYDALRQKVHWISGGLPEDGRGAMPERGAPDRETESLAAFLCDQLERRRLPKPLLALCRYLAELADEDGRLSQEDLDGVAALKIPQPLIQQALETLQSLEPAGVGARSLSECLLLQLARQKDASPLDMEIVRQFLPELGRKHYGLIAKKLGVTRRRGAGGGEAHRRPGPLPRPVLSDAGAHAVCPAGRVHRRAGRQAPGDPQ